MDCVSNAKGYNVDFLSLLGSWSKEKFHVFLKETIESYNCHRDDDIGDNRVSQIAVKICFEDCRYKRAKKFVSSEMFDCIMENTANPNFFSRMRLPFRTIVWKNYMFFDYLHEFELASNGEDTKGFISVFCLQDDGYMAYTEISMEEFKSVPPEALKFLYYLNSERPDIEPRQYTKAERLKVSNGKIAETIYVGRKYKSIKGVKTGVKIDKRFIVSGHWRNQPVKCGYKTIFIEPYYKGNDDMAKIIDKVYQL